MGYTNPKVGGANLLFGQIFTENCMKMKEIWPTGRARAPAPLDPIMYETVFFARKVVQNSKCIVYFYITIIPQCKVW